MHDFNNYLLAIGITQTKQKKLDEEHNAVVDKLNIYFKPKVNVTYERYVFLNKQNKENLKVQQTL